MMIPNIILTKVIPIDKLAKKAAKKPVLYVLIILKILTNFMISLTLNILNILNIPFIPDVLPEDDSISIRLKGKLHIKSNKNHPFK